MAMIAFFLQHLRLRGKSAPGPSGPPPQPTLPAIRRQLETSRNLVIAGPI
jgi:hypothetical protein